MAMVVGRRVLGSYVAALCGGSGLNASGKEVDPTDISAGAAGSVTSGDEEWWKKGEEVFIGDEGEELRKAVVEGVLNPGGMTGWCDEQVSGASQPSLAMLWCGGTSSSARQQY
jgi:COP9 signalosome complex subunit 4